MSIRNNTNDHKYATFFIIIPILIAAFMWFKNNFPILSLVVFILALVALFMPSKKKRE